MSSVFELDLEKNCERIDTEYEISGLVQVASCIFRFQKLSWSRVGLHWVVDLVFFVEGENTYDFFNILALRE